MKKRILLVSTAALSFLTLTGFHGGCGRSHAEKIDEAKVQRLATARVESALDDLDATDAQKQQVLKLKEGLVKDAVAFAEANRGAKTELFKQWESNRPDAAAMKAVVHARIDELDALADKAVDAVVQLHAILTPEQRAEVNEELRERLR